MSVSLKLVNLEEEFNCLKNTPIIVNDFKTDTLERKNLILSKILTKYNSDVMDSIPRCDCGELSGADRKDQYCHNCMSTVSFKLEDRIEAILWARSPSGVAKFINPMVWNILSKFLKRSQWDVLEWLCSTTYQGRGREPAEIKLLKDINYKRGYNHFVENFWETLETLFSLPAYRKKPNKEEIFQLLNHYRDCIFSSYIPFPNRALLVIENTDYDRYAEPVIFSAVDAIDTITSIDCNLIQHKVWVKENRTVKTIAAIAKFTEQYFRDHVARKSGLFRKHFFASRAHYSFRAVITSITREHEYDEIHIPWNIAMGAFRTFLQNKLERRGYTCNQITDKINKYAASYDPELDEIFKELIDESPEKGIVVTFCRNPTLGMGSIQRVRVTEVKTNLNDPTISMSILITKAYNA